MRKYVKRTITCILMLAVCTAFPIQALADSSSSSGSAAGNVKGAEANAGLFNVHRLIEDNYSTVLGGWSGKVPVGGNTRITLNPSKSMDNQEILVTKQNSHGYGSDTIRWEENGKITLNVDVKKTGLYQIALDYYSLNNSILPSEGSIQINHKYPFYEARRIIFNSLWKAEIEQKNYDRYGNELLPMPSKVHTWQRTYAYDASYLYTKPLLFKLNQGNNTITLTNTRGTLLLGNVYIDSPLKTLSYSDYMKQAPPAANPGSRMITLEAENMALKNDSSIRPASDQDPSVTPYSNKHHLLNVLDGSSWNKGGQSVAWNVSVPVSGRYNLAFKYKEAVMNDLPVYRSIEIDGKVPFQALDNVPFQFSRTWSNRVLSGQDGKPFSFYLKRGRHTITMTVNLSKMRPLAEEITNTMAQIDQLSLKIQKLTGNKVDAYRDWSLTDYIPDVQKDLTTWANNLEKQYQFINALNPAVSHIGEVSNLGIAVKQLRKLAENPDQLPNNLNLLSQGSGSVSQLLGDLYKNITESPLTLDKVYVYAHHSLPKPTVGLGKKMIDNLTRFFLSFGKQQYAAVNHSGGKLNVWVNRPRQYVELMQKMIDEQFTPKYGIKVNLSVMPDENKLVLANATGEQPDVALGVDNWIPYDLSLRGALLNLKQFSGFQSLIQHFSKGSVIPMAYEKGIYGIPETQDFWVLFYRKDILKALQLPVPNTWNDVLNMLPQLQRYGMNFYDPLSQYSGFKPFISTTPFIYQFGGELYDKNGMSTAIDSKNDLAGIKFMSDLFTIYNLPEEVPNFYNHFRYGSLPVGISDFTTYIQLKTAAPEIANSWGISLYPGVNHNGTVERWAPSGGQAGMIFKKTKHPQQSWQFLRWWMSKDVQVQFANRLQTTFGPTYMWNTANLDAFKELPWPSQDKQVILNQFKWVRDASRVPGGYMLERGISNIWNKIVFNGKNPRSTIDDSVITINREIKRKMEEFGFRKDGKVVKNYPVPTIDNIDDWIENR